MKKYRVFKQAFLYSGLIATFLMSSFSLAQSELNLFQETDNRETSQNPSRRAERGSQRETEPAFSLIGTSRFGDEYSASLLARSGQTIKVEWKKDTVIQIDGFRNYRIANIGSRKVTILLPDSETCIENEAKGVRCNGNMALLTLSNATPMELKVPVAESVITEESEFESVTINESDSAGFPDNPNTIPGTNVLRRNPFSGELQTLPDRTPEEQAEVNRIRAERAERFRNFEVVRIADDDIPEGMQRVRTPFGDSLEPAED